MGFPAERRYTAPTSLSHSLLAPYLEDNPAGSILSPSFSPMASCCSGWKTGRAAANAAALPVSVCSAFSRIAAVRHVTFQNHRRRHRVQHILTLFAVSAVFRKDVRRAYGRLPLVPQLHGNGHNGPQRIGQLTEAVRRKPYSVVLFDEIEKAHPDVFNVLLQVLDDGRITDSQGRTVDFKNTILIMTSNIGSPYLLDGIDENGEIKPEAQSQVMDDLRGHFRPEFLNRLDEIIMFKPLTKSNIGKIVDLMVGELDKRLADQELSLELTDTAKDQVIENGYDPVYGARPLKRYLQKYVETLAARKILSGDVHAGDTLVLDVQNGEFIVTVKDGN